MNYLYSYDNEIRAWPTVQIHAMETTMKLVGISHVCAGEIIREHNLESAVQLFIEWQVGVDFHAAVFRSLSEVTAKKGLENATDGDLLEEKTDREYGRIKKSSDNQKWKRENVQGERR